MKKQIISIIIGILLLVSPIMAQEIEVDPGITPDQGFLWELDMIMERIQIMFASKLEEKATLRLQIAEERLAEMKTMMEQNKIQYMNKAEVKRNEVIDEVEEDAKGLTEEHRDFVMERLQKHVEVLEQVRERATERIQEGLNGEQAKIGLDNAIEKSSQVIERIKFRQNQNNNN